MQKLLKMIETYDPSNHDGMDDIDALVWKYLDMPLAVASPTRSRDILKGIRPDGWFLSMEGWPQDEPPLWRYKISLHKIGNFISPPLPTEELAELHAIIQAIEYERNNDKNN